MDRATSATHPDKSIYWRSRYNQMVAAINRWIRIYPSWQVDFLIDDMQRATRSPGKLAAIRHYWEEIIAESNARVTPEQEYTVENSV